MDRLGALWAFFDLELHAVPGYKRSMAIPDQIPVMDKILRAFRGLDESPA